MLARLWSNMDLPSIVSSGVLKVPEMLCYQVLGGWTMNVARYGDL
jgi:hypothetical protein